MLPRCAFPPNLGDPAVRASTCVLLLRLQEKEEQGTGAQATASESERLVFETWRCYSF